MRFSPTSRRLALYRVGLVVAIIYFVVAGVLVLWFPSDGLDLYVSYVAGTCGRQGVSPYDHAAYVRTWQSLPTPAPLAITVYFPFAYPPSWIPACVVLSLLPWRVALALWKVLNVAFLVGSVLLTFRLLQAYARDTADRYAAWCFALVLSPTISVMVTGQASLFVLFMLLLAGYGVQQGRPGLSGLALALAMTKPQMAAPFVLFLLFRRELVVVSVGAAFAAALMGLGMYLSRSDIGTYLAGIARYAGSSQPTSDIAVGIASLLGHLMGFGAGPATAIGTTVGVLLTAVVVFHTRTRAPSGEMADVLPVLLYLAPLGFHCNGYDLVALIPLFVWSRVADLPALPRVTIQGLCVALLVPRAAIRLVLQTIARGLVPDGLARVGELSFRSWVLVLLLPMVLLAFRSKMEATRPVTSDSSP